MTDIPPETSTRKRQIAENIAQVRERIARVATAAGRKENDITLCAVTKTRPVADVLAAVAAGVQDIGENYVQEAREKIPAVRAALSPETPLRCHLIGHLQTNKVKYVIEFAQVIHSVDSEDLLQEIAKRVQKLYNVATRISVLIEVNLTGDPGRAGIVPEETPDLVARANAIPMIALSGLMGMAPPVAHPDDARPYFARLKRLFDALPSENRQILSMGMSGDFEAAITEGATLIRVGTAIFGQRT